MPVVRNCSSISQLLAFPFSKLGVEASKSFKTFSVKKDCSRNRGEGDLHIFMELPSVS